MTQHLFALLTLALDGRCSHIDWKKAEWNTIVDFAISHNIAGLVFLGLEKLMADPDVNELIAEDTQEPIGLLYIEKMRQKKELNTMFGKSKELASLLRQHHIRTVAIKGFSIARMYPKGVYRNSCDLDMLPLGKQGAWDEVNQLMEAMGNSVNKKIYLHSVFLFDGLHVENHQYLTAVKGDKRMRRFEALLMELLEKEGTKPIKSSDLETTGPMFTSVYTIYHSFKHMLRNEMTMKMVCDWAVIMNHTDTRQGIDWQQLWDICQRYGMLRFAQCLTTLAATVCGLSCPPGIRRDEKGEQLLLNYIMSVTGSSETQSGKWSERINLLRNTFIYRDRYKEFSDLTSLKAAWHMVKGRFED